MSLPMGTKLKNLSDMRGFGILPSRVSMYRTFRASKIIWAITRINISSTPQNVLESLGLHVSSDLFVALLLSGYYHILLTLFFPRSMSSPCA